MTKPRRKQKRKPDQEGEEAPQQRKRRGKTRPVSEADTGSISGGRQDVLPEADPRRGDLPRREANSGGATVTNATSEQRLERLEQIIRQIAQLTAQYAGGTGGGETPSRPQGVR